MCYIAKNSAVCYLALYANANPYLNVLDRTYAVPLVKEHCLQKRKGA